MKKISVIVPVYNTEKYLVKCLNSLVNQTLKEIEILVINDGSTDHSQVIMEDFLHRYPEKIKIYTKENGGLSDARNFGIDRAEGEFIGFVDSDDYVEPHMYEQMYTLAKEHAAEMVTCNLQKVNEGGAVTRKLPQIPHLPERIELKDHLSIFSDLSYFACNKLFDKRLFRHHRFKIGIHFEDIELIPQLLLECDIIAQTQNYHYQYLERADSISKSHSDKGLDIFRAIENVEEAFEISPYKERRDILKNFQILEGVYSFLAYLAYVKDDAVYSEMSLRLKKFMFKRNISRKEIIEYRRFGKNYLVSLSTRKKIYYLLYLFGGEKLLRRLLK